MFNLIGDSTKEKIENLLNLCLNLGSHVYFSMEHLKKRYFPMFVLEKNAQGV